jgi:hypothetical protein
MTVKRNGENVILKGGKVSCSCCGGSICCVYPAPCGIGPESIQFFGSTLSGKNGVYGNTTNGVILEDDFWAVYRNGRKRFIACLGITIFGSVSVSVQLPSSLFLSFNFNSETYTSTLEFSGGPIEGFTNESLFGEVLGQCSWGGAVEQITQNFDEGFILLFNPGSCRWELADGPLSFIYAYREDDSPLGSYISDSEGTSFLIE